MKRKHAELIHAWADGAGIEVLTAEGWITTRVPAWDENSKYRLKPKEPEWYENIPPQGVLCWVYDVEGTKELFLRVIKGKEGELFRVKSGSTWKYATPLTNDEIKGFLR